MHAVRDPHANIPCLDWTSSDKLFVAGDLFLREPSVSETELRVIWIGIIRAVHELHTKKILIKGDPSRFIIELNIPMPILFLMISGAPSNYPWMPTSVVSIRRRMVLLIGLSSLLFIFPMTSLGVRMAVSRCLFRIFSFLGSCRPHSYQNYVTAHLNNNNELLIL